MGNLGIDIAKELSRKDIQCNKDEQLKEFMQLIAKIDVLLDNDYILSHVKINNDIHNMVKKLIIKFL